MDNCRRLPNAAPSPSISSGFDPDICPADNYPRCLVPSVSCARERFLASMRRASMRAFLPIPNADFCFKMHNSGRIWK